MTISDGKVLRVLQNVKKSSAVFCLTLVRKPSSSGSNASASMWSSGHNRRGKEHGNVTLSVNSLTLDITYHFHLPLRKNCHLFPTSSKGGWESGHFVCSEDKGFGKHVALLLPHLCPGSTMGYSCTPAVGSTWTLWGTAAGVIAHS